MIEPFHFGIISYLISASILRGMTDPVQGPRHVKKQAEKALPLQYDAAPIVTTFAALSADAKSMDNRNFAAL